MRSRNVIAVGAAAASLGLSLLGLPNPASAARTAVVCQNNLNPADDTLQSIPAQKFQGSPALHTRGAMLIKVPAGGSCVVNYLYAIGRLSGSAPSITVNVWVRADTTIGMHKPTGPNLAPGNLNLVPVVSTPSGYYNLTTNLASPVTMTAPPTSDLLFWVVAQAKITPLVGKWTWEVGIPDPAGNSDVWRNPGGGWGCGTGWKVVSIGCLGGAPGKGLMGEVG